MYSTLQLTKMLDLLPLVFYPFVGLGPLHEKCPPMTTLFSTLIKTKIYKSGKGC